MANKLKKVLIVILILLPLGVKADTGKINLECNKNSVVPGEVITCTIKGSSTGEVSSLNSKIVPSSNLTLNSVSVDSIWQGSNEANLDLYTDVNKTGTFNIATFAVKVSNDIIDGSDESISVDLTKFYGADYKGYDVEKVTHDIRVLSTVNTLSSITLSKGTLSPNFNSNTTSYTATVDSDKVTINATKIDEKSSVSGNIGEVKLNYGVNTFKINVTSESSSTKIYTISVTRPDNRSKENYLLSFEFNGYDINFDKEKTEYTFDVENNVSKIGVCDKNTIKDNLLCINEEDVEISNKASTGLYLGDYDLYERFGELIDEIVKECDDEVCTLYLGDEVVGKYDEDTLDEWYIPVQELKVGLNTLKMVITSENECVRTYTFNINRKSAVVEGENSESNSGGSSNDSIKNSPTTGSLEIYIVLGIVVTSVVVGLYYCNQYQKKNGENKNEEK